MADASGLLRDGNGAFCGGGPDGECGTAAPVAGSEGWKEWDEEATELLLDLYTDRYLGLQRGTLRAKEWQEVVDGLNERCAGGRPVYNYNRCKNKIDSLKKTFKSFRDKRRLGGGGGGVKWRWYNRIERITTGVGVGVGSGSGSGSGKRMRVASASAADYGFGGEAAAAAAEDGLHVPPVNLDEEAAILRSYCGASAPPVPPMHWMPEAGVVESSKRRTAAAGEEQGNSDAIREMAMMMVQALERMEDQRQRLEERRMELMRELHVKRTETQLEIARMIIENHSGHHRG